MRPRQPANSSTRQQSSMKDLRIVIVSWNVREELERCLTSLEGACRGLDWDVVVVDNASADETSAINKSQIPNNKFIFNEENRGFARACNQGLTDFDARYVLLLNPDTVCPEGSLTELVKAADARPKAGIVGPKILNEDGSLQTSLRRYPAFSDQLGILFKLHNFIPNAGVFRRYFAKDRSLEEEASVEQVMGSCFLIRRELIEEIGGLDERYFAWFEEVDYCKTAVEHGWEVRYVPSVSILHMGGHSFGQVRPVRKQRIFNTSLIAYFRKWHPDWQARILSICSGVSLGLAWLAGTIGFAGKGSRDVLKREDESNSLRTKVRNWFLIVLALELVSFLTIFQDDWNAFAIIVLGLVMGVVSYKRPTLGIAIILLELLIGSKGALLQLWGWPGTISLRMMLFMTFFIGWFGNFLTHGDVKRLVHALWQRKEWVAIFIVLVYAVVIGKIAGNEFLFADANAWAFLALLVPVLDLSIRKGEELKQDVLPVLFVGPLWLAVKTIGLEYFFGHGFKGISTNVYLWVRRTGVGEVTLVTVNAFRIFMQSYVYYVPALIIGVAWYLRGEIPNNKSQITRFVHLWLIATFVVLGVSLSRSIWIGCFVGILALAVFYRKELIKAWKKFLMIVADGVIALAIIFVALAIPLPPVDFASLGDLFGSRASAADAASVSRWNLLPVITDRIKEAPIFGNGFGATLTYESKDPRILADHPDGMYTTYAFEWGWLEHWVKFGVIGFGAMIYLIYRLLRRTWAMKQPKWLIYGVFASLLGIAAVHVFSPYFNHPLGLGALMLVEGWLTVGE